MNIVRLSPQLHNILKYIYLGWALVLVCLGTVVMLPVINQIGSNYGGFIWMYDSTRQPSFFISFELWRSQPPVPTEIRFLDEIESINGRSSLQFGEVYKGASAGDVVSYVVRRHNEKLLIQEPVRVFTVSNFIISHGLLYLAGLLYVLSGFVILRNTNRKDFAIFSFLFLFGGGAWLGHSDVWGVSAPYPGYEALNLVFFTPSAPMAAAILSHFAAYYPRPQHRVLQNRFFPWLLYALAILLILSYTLTRTPNFAKLNIALVMTMFAYLTIAILLVLMRSLKSYLAAQWKKDEDQRRILEPMLIASMVGFLTFTLIGIIPVLAFGYTLVPFEIWIALMLVAPLIFIYAIRNSELVEHLQQEVLLRQQYSDQVEELRNIRERTLHEVADALHDQIIPELRGLYFASTALQRQLDTLTPKLMGEDLAFITNTLDTVSKDVRTIMEGAKPVEWEYTELPRALSWLIEGFQRHNRHLNVRLDVNGYEDHDSPTIKEALYWIARAALSNVQDHAQARNVTISLSSDQAETRLIIADDGVGFKAEGESARKSSRRRHLGLTNMRLRALEIAAHLSIESRPGEGTRITVIAPRGEKG